MAGEVTKAASKSKGLVGQLAKEWAGMMDTVGWAMKGLGKLISGVLSLPVKAFNAVFGGVAKGANHVSIQGAKGVAKGGVAVIKAPFVGLGKIGKGVFAFAKGHPILTGGAVVAGGAIAWGNAQRDKAERDTQQEMQDKVLSREVRGSTYSNSVTPEEYAMLIDRQNQNQNGSRAAAVEASRAEAGQTVASV